MDGHVPPSAPTTDGSPEQDRRLTRYITALAVVAVVVPVVVVLVAPDTTPAATSWTLAVLLGLGVVATELFHVRIRVGPTLQSTTLVEVALLPVVLLFEPVTAITVGFAAGVLAELLLRQADRRKFVFNLSWHVTGIALASLAFTGLTGGAAFDDSARSIAAAVVAAAVFVGWNTTTYAGIVGILSDRRPVTVLREESQAPLLINAGTSAVGFLLALLILEAAAALPVLALLGFTLHQRQRDESAAQERIGAERDRFARTLSGSSDGVVLLDATGTVEVWNPAMETLTGIPEADAVGASLEELGWARLAAAATEDEEGELRLKLASQVLAVRRATVPGTRTGQRGTVLTVRDVSRDAEVARIREDLVMRVSHELRTPLTSLEGFLEVLTEHGDRLDDDGRRELLQAARRGSRRLTHLVTNLMVWARIESRAAAAPGALGVADLLDGLREALAEVALEDVLVEADPGAAVAADADDVHTILVNLLANAALYGAPPVSVRIRVRGDTVDLEVSDAGTGLPAGSQTDLFEPFSQASEGIQRTAKGLGMGLAIVRSLAASLGGSVSAGRGPAGGARLTVTLPAAPPQSPATVGVGASGASSSSR